MSKRFSLRPKRQLFDEGFSSVPGKQFILNPKAAVSKLQDECKFQSLRSISCA